MGERSRVVGTVFGLLLVASALPSYGQAAGPFQFHSVTPCRLIDTRIAPATILQSAVERKVPVQGVCGIPVGATAVAVNITAISPTNQGRLTLYPSGITPPFVSSINFPAGTFALNNGAIVPLADQTAEPNDLAVMPFVLGNGQVHMTLDVTGFFQ